MTDKEKLETLFTEFGVGCVSDPDYIQRKDGRSVILCEESAGKIGGYNGFYTLFEFDKNGKFIEMGAWE